MYASAREWAHEVRRYRDVVSAGVRCDGRVHQAGEQDQSVYADCKHSESIAANIGRDRRTRLGGWLRR